MEIHLLQFVPWLGILGHRTPPSSPSSDAGVVWKSKTNMLQAWREERRLNQSLSSPLNVLISPGVKGQGMGQDFKNAAVKYMCKSRVIIVSVLYRNVVTAFALWMYTQLSAAMLFAANMAAMCEGRVERHPPRVCSHFSFHARMYEWFFTVCVCVCLCPTSPACCLIASSLTQPTRRASMQCNTLVLYLSSGLERVCCQTRVIRWYDSVIQL